MDKNIIFKTIFGSHLYGTDRPTSDSDFKGVFIEEYKNIVLKKDHETIHIDTKVNNREKNKSEDVDTELIELRKFIKDCLQGQTYALDMIFSSRDKWLESSTIWEYIVLNRNKLLSKNVEPYIGYCRQQAGKYGLKGSRLGELLKMIEFLRRYQEEYSANMLIVKFKKAILETFKNSEFIEFVTLEHKHKDREPTYDEYLKVLGKHFSVNARIKDVLPALEITNNRYGERARLAEQNEGVDWKAISHAYRCMYQLEELATTGYINFPLKDRDYLRALKGGLVSYSVVQDELPIIMDLAIQSVKGSTLLPEQPDYDFWDNFIVETYGKN